MIENYLDEIAEADAEIAQYTQEIETLQKQRKATNQRKRECVVDALRELQGGLDDDAVFPLLAATEFGRSGSYRFTEVLTADGVETRNVVRTYTGDREEPSSNSALYTWEEPLVTVGEYLEQRQQHTRASHATKLAERLEYVAAGSDELPDIRYQGRPA